MTLFKCIPLPHKFSFHIIDMYIFWFIHKSIIFQWNGRIGISINTHQRIKPLVKLIPEKICVRLHMVPYLLRHKSHWVSWFHIPMEMTTIQQPVCDMRRKKKREYFGTVKQINQNSYLLFNKKEDSFSPFWAARISLHTKYNRQEGPSIKEPSSR